MIMKRCLFALAFAACVSARAGAFVPGSSITSHVARGGAKAKAAAPVAQKGAAKAPSTAVQSAASSASASSGKENSALMETLQTGSYFALWYLFNIAYNIYNKQSLNVLDFPWTVATIQMGVGILYFMPLWILGLRKAPKLSMAEIKTLIPIALCHTGVHVGAVVALGAGAVSFAHIVKASEPVVTCGMNFLLLGEKLPLAVYATLLPIIGGVAIASMKELSFTMLALAAAMLSNVSSAARGVLSKKTMSGKKIGENMDAQNLYAVLTLMSTIMLVPMMLGMEGLGFLPAFNEAIATGEYTKKGLATLLALSGASYYAYNEVAFLALGKVNPVTHAVGNTIKRVVIIVASVVAFKTPMSTGSVIGSTIAILGTLLYSLAMNASKK